MCNRVHILLELITSEFEAIKCLQKKIAEIKECANKPQDGVPEFDEWDLAVFDAILAEEFGHEAAYREMLNRRLKEAKSFDRDMLEKLHSRRDGLYAMINQTPGAYKLDVANGDVSDAATDTAGGENTSAEG